MHIMYLTYSRHPLLSLNHIARLDRSRRLVLLDERWKENPEYNQAVYVSVGIDELIVREMIGANSSIFRKFTA